MYYRIDINPKDFGPTFFNIIDEVNLMELMKKYEYTEDNNGVIIIESEDGIIFKFKKIIPETIENMNLIFCKVKKK